MENRLLKKLAERYTLKTTPDVATTVEQGLMQLSSGIYTEEERFILSFCKMLLILMMKRQMES